jgi:hypothetical protein
MGVKVLLSDVSILEGDRDWGSRAFGLMRIDFAGFEEVAACV